MIEDIGRNSAVCTSTVHGKKKSAAGPMDQLLRKAAGPQQKLLSHTLNRMLSFTFKLSSRQDKIILFLWHNLFRGVSLNQLADL